MSFKRGQHYGIAYNNRGILRQMKGDSSGSMADYNQSIKINPKNARAYNNRGLVEENKGDLNGAMADYNQSIKIIPNYAIAYNNRGNTK
jgi:Flp pilus assembly protein TadD